MLDAAVKEYITQLELGVNIRNITIASHKKAEQALLE